MESYDQARNWGECGCSQRYRSIFPSARRTDASLLKRLKTLNIPNQKQTSAPGPPPPGADEVYWTAILWFLSVVLAKSVEFASVKRRNTSKNRIKSDSFSYKGENPTKPKIMPGKRGKAPYPIHPPPPGWYSLFWVGLGWVGEIFSFTAGHVSPRQWIWGLLHSS